MSNKRKTTTEIVEQEPEPVESVAVDIEPPKKVHVPVIRLKNNLNQMVPLNIRRADGSSVGIEIPARSEIVWPDVNLGPDVAVKTGKKYITILR